MRAERQLVNGSWRFVLGSEVLPPPTQPEPVPVPSPSAIGAPPPAAEATEPVAEPTDEEGLHATDRD